MGRLVILSGPSCVGKSPLERALRRLYPELHRRLRKVVLFNSRAPRPGEIDGVDYHFRQRGQVERLGTEGRYAVLEVRGDRQAVDITQLQSLLEEADVFFEGNPFVGGALQTHPQLTGVDRVGIFLSPLSREEILFFREEKRNLSLPDFVADVMRRKLLRRTRRQKGELSAADLDDIETRARSAYRELKQAWNFQYVIANHDGEDSDHWEAFYYPIGDARKSLEAVVSLLEGVVPASVEHWEAGLVP
jgi:guanylate kinase